MGETAQQEFGPLGGRAILEGMLSPPPSLAPKWPSGRTQALAPVDPGGRACGELAAHLAAPASGGGQPVELPLFDAAQCDAWQAEVMALRRHWTPRHPSLPFFTLGLAAYLDIERRGRSGRGTYWSVALRSHYNALLQRHFGRLLDGCLAGLSAHAGLPARFAPERASLPGFHIHLPHPVFSGEVASIHRDLQFLDVFAEVRAQPEDVMTFTVPMALPEGSGLNIWSQGDKHFHAYRLGSMLVHDGLATHQAVLHPQAGESARIMLQGHALRHQGELVLYW
jgi:hypothetical protein